MLFFNNSLVVWHQSPHTGRHKTEMMITHELGGLLLPLGAVQEHLLLCRLSLGHWSSLWWFKKSPRACTQVQRYTELEILLLRLHSIYSKNKRWIHDLYFGDVGEDDLYVFEVLVIMYSAVIWQIQYIAMFWPPPTSTPKPLLFFINSHASRLAAWLTACFGDTMFINAVIYPN